MRRLAAVGIALAIAAGSAAAAFAVGGVAGLPSELLRSEYPGYDEVASWEFMSGEYDALAEAGASPELVLGSSELKPGPAGPAHPAAMFSDGRFGATSVIAGRAGVNDLWQAIELGALAPHLPEGSRRAVVFVSMQWFMCYRDPQSSFPGVFSQGAYDAFMANGSIPDGVKRRVAARAEEYGALGSGGSDACPLARARRRPAARLEAPLERGGGSPRGGRRRGGRIGALPRRPSRDRFGRAGLGGDRRCGA